MASFPISLPCQASNTLGVCGEIAKYYDVDRRSIYVAWGRYNHVKAIAYMPPIGAWLFYDVQFNGTKVILLKLNAQRWHSPSNKFPFVGQTRRPTRLRWFGCQSASVL